VKVAYSGDVRFSTATQVPEMVDSYNFASYYNAANTNAGSGNFFTNEIMEKIQNFIGGKYTDPTQPEYYGTTAGTDWKMVAI